MVEIEIEEGRLLPDLVAMLRRAGCATRELDERSLLAEVAGVSEAQARRELALLLAVWRARHPGVGAGLIEASGSRRES